MDGLLILEWKGALSTPFNASAVPGWLMYARFLLAPNQAAEELDSLEMGDHVLAVSGPFVPGWIPKPVIPTVDDENKKPPPKALDSVHWIRRDMTKPLTLLNRQDSEDHLPCSDPLRYFESLRPRVTINRRTGSVLQQDGFFESPVYWPRLRSQDTSRIELLFRSSLWSQNELEALTALCSELGFGARRSQGFGSVDVSFKAQSLPDLGTPTTTTHLLLFGDALPERGMNPGSSLYTTRVHYGRCADDGFPKDPLLLLQRGSLVATNSPSRDWVAWGNVHRSSQRDGVRTLASAQTLAWPVSLSSEFCWE